MRKRTYIRTYINGTLYNGIRSHFCLRLPSARAVAGQALVELLLVIGLSAITLPALLTGLVASREGKAEQGQRVQAVALMKETEEAVRNVREKGWSAFAVAGIYHPASNGTSWTLASGSEAIDGFTRQVVVSDVYRDSPTGPIVTSGGTLDPSTKKIDISVSWGSPFPSSVSSMAYLTRYLDNISYTQTTDTDFNSDVKTNVQVTKTVNGEVLIANNDKAKWCSPAFSTSTIDLPDGPPVAVSATASASTTTIPNDVFVATSPTATSSVKLAYVNVTANTDPPVSTLRGTFTMDATKYSAAGFVPTGTGLDNDFVTNDVQYYTSSGGNLYALIATTIPDKEVIAVQIKNGGTDSYQDPTNKIYKYWTYFNTRIYEGNTSSQPSQDQDPYGYGAASVEVLGNRGYTISGGYLYVFDLSDIDSKTPTDGLDMIGCRIELDGYDCNPGSGIDRKYSSGQTGASWSSTAGPVHNDCSDGGNIELHADDDIFPIKVGGSTYVYVAVGAGTNPEFEIANVTNVPTSSTSPRINSSSCGTISRGSSGWSKSGDLDFNSRSSTEEAANSVFAKADGTRAYVSSNGGIDGNGDGSPDSKQFYVIDTTSKTTPKFLSGTESSGATSGYYSGDTTNIQLYPRRSLTVLNGQRAVLVGKDGVADGTEPQEYQVLNIDNESSPAYCGGLNFAAGFNDLTSVSEADFDNFVYMVTNTNDKQLKIIQGGPDGTYLEQGTLESAVFDAGYSSTFNRYSITFTTPTNTSAKFQFAVADPVGGSCTNANYVYVGPDGTTGTYYTNATGSVYLGSPGNGYTNPGECFRYKAYLSTTDFNATPEIDDVSVNYSP